MFWDAVYDVRYLLEVGGQVLVTIFVVALGLWTLIVERFWYAKWVHPERVEAVQRAWQAIEDKTTWDAAAIRRLMISEVVMDLNRGLALIRALVAVCPLLGLLGTTTGMVEVYEVMAIEGSSEPRAMAAGVSQAMVTTMAGLVVSLSGIFFSFRLESQRIRERDSLDHRLHVDKDLLAHHHRVRSQAAKLKARKDNEMRRLRAQADRRRAEDRGRKRLVEREAAGRGKGKPDG